MIANVAHSYHHIFVRENFLQAHLPVEICIPHDRLYV